MPEGTRFCMNCGSTMIPQETNGQASGEGPRDGIDGQYRQYDQYQQNGGYQQQKPDIMTLANSYSSTPGNYPLKWFKFLIYFSLWASAVLNTVNALNLFRGAEYGEFKAAFYSNYPALRPLDYSFAVVCLGFAGFSIFTRFRLAGFKKNAPKLLLLLYIVSAAVSILYNLLLKAVLGMNVELDYVVITSQIITSVFMIIVNSIYFKKREDLFIN